MAKPAPRSNKTKIVRVEGKDRKPAKKYSSRWMKEHGYETGQMIEIGTVLQEARTRVAEGYIDLVFVQADQAFMPGKAHVYLAREEVNIGTLANAPGDGLGAIVTETLGANTEYGVLRILKKETTAAYADKKVA